MKLRATTVLHYKGIHDESFVATRFEIAWDDVEWLDMSGLRRYEKFEWLLLIHLVRLGARRAGIAFEHKEVAT